MRVIVKTPKRMYVFEGIYLYIEGNIVEIGGFRFKLDDENIKKLRGAILSARQQIVVIDAVEV